MKNYCVYVCHISQGKVLRRDRHEYGNDLVIKFFSLLHKNSEKKKERKCILLEQLELWQFRRGGRGWIVVNWSVQEYKQSEV